MPFARIVTLRVPMTDTDRHCQCTEYEAVIIKQRWSDPSIKKFDRERKITVEPMPLDGEHDPYREVGDAEAEQARMIKLHGKTLFHECFNVSSFQQAHKSSVVPRNEWLEAHEAAMRDAEATATAAAAVKTAQLVDQAVEGIRRAREQDELERETAPSAPAKSGKTTKP